MGLGQRRPPTRSSTSVAKRSHDLRHFDQSVWQCAAPAEVAQRAGNSIDLLVSWHAKLLYDRLCINNQRIEAVEPRTSCSTWISSGWTEKRGTIDGIRVRS